MAPTTKEEEGGEAWESRLLRRRTPAGSPTPPAGTAPSPPPSQRGKRERPGSSRGRKRARATGREDEKDAEAAAASASPPAGHASSGASSGTSSPLRWPELPRAVLGEDSYGEQILEPFHEIDPAIVRAHGKLKTKYFAKLDRQLKLVSLDQRIPSSCMVDPRLLSVRKAATNSILQIAKVTVGLSSYIDDKMLGRTSGFLIDWDVENRIGTVLTSALVIQSKSPSLDEWSATDEYATHAEVRVHFMDKAATTVVANLLHYDKHYNLALFKVSMDLSAQIPSFTSELKFAEEVFVLGRDEGRYLTIDHGNVAYEGPSRLQRHHYMFITRRINKLGIGGPVINHGGQVAGMYSHPGLAFTPSSIILRCLQMWKSFNCILRLHVGMKFSAISLLDLPHREVIACKCDIDDGLIVTQVSEGSIAEKLGVRHGDIIKSWNGENISTTIELENFLLDMCEKHLDKGNSIGSSVDLSIGIFHTRKGKHGTIKMTVNVSDDVEVIAEGTYPVTTADCTSGDDDDSGIIQGAGDSAVAGPAQAHLLPLPQRLVPVFSHPARGHSTSCALLPAAAAARATAPARPTLPIPAAHARGPLLAATMRFDLDGMPVHFPYAAIYPEQHAYMGELKRALDARGHALLEMPTGTGKTAALISLITSYSLANPSRPLRLIYCTRTVHEMEKTLAELRLLFAHLPPAASRSLLALGLSSRKNLCVHPQASAAAARDSVDTACRRLTASWVREKAASDPESTPLCEFYETFDRAAAAGDLASLMPPGVYTLADLRALGRQRRVCPYFLARQMVKYANVVVYSYQYLLDPKVASIVSREMQKECVVVFDEAHNIDNVCIEALSVSIRKQTLEGAERNLRRISQEIDRFKATDANRLRAEYNRLVDGLAQRGNLPISDAWLANPALPDDILREAVPGNIRRAEHFLAVLRRLVRFLDGRLETENVENEMPIAFVASIHSSAGIDQKMLRFCYDRLHSLMMTLEITDTDEFMHIQTICDFATLIGTYTRGFSIIIEPYDERMPDIRDPVIQLSCHDASLAIRPVFDRFETVVITSGTLSPIDLYPRLLNFNPVISRSFTMSLTRDCICPMVLTRGSDQLPVSTKFDMRSDPGVVRNYGRLLLEMASAVPDGIVCFFVSYSYMDGIVNSWHEMGILQDIMQYKLVFIETPDVVETTLALDNYRKACDCGRGAVFFSVARGKVAEGIDFDRHYGRLVIMFGVPFQYTLSRILLARLEYLRETFQIKEGDFLTFDALRQAAQCVGRVIRSKADYGMMIFADKRYSRHDKRSKLPGWILSHLHDAHLNLSTDMALHIAREFLRRMAQPYDKTGSGGKKTLLTEEDLQNMAQDEMEM